jgi:pyruvate,orthophosphate dikinase
MAIVIKAKVEPVQLFRFGNAVDGNAMMKNLLGGKGANLAEMSGIGIPVPSGFTIPCTASVNYKKYRDSAPHLSAFLTSLWGQLSAGSEYLTHCSGHTPLVSVRSGSRVSMPGMMDTILNVGITMETLPFWKEKLGERTALDSYRRLIQMYGSVALGIPMEEFDKIFQRLKYVYNVSLDVELSASALDELVVNYLGLVGAHGHEFPDTFEDQLRGAVISVFRSWDNPRAIEYRKINGIPEEWGTAVNVQSMVFGNLNDQSATGVVFTRCPSTGKSSPTGEYLVNAQGEDVVAGIRTPDPIEQMFNWNPAVTAKLLGLLEKLELHYKDMQDVEFTVQSGDLYILQTRNGKRSAKAAFKIAHDLAEEGVISRQEALSRVNHSMLLASMQSEVDTSFSTPPHLTGIAAGGGIVSGVIVLSSPAAVNCTSPCVLVTNETNPNDIAGMNASVGILTATGGLTSHAAVVARGMNKTCVVGATALTFKQSFTKLVQVGNLTFKEGDKVTIDGATGNVWFGIDVPILPAGATSEARTMAKWQLAMSGAVERLDVSSDMGEQEMADLVLDVATPALYVDTAVFESNGLDGLEKLGSALAKVSGVSIVVDLSPMTTLLPPVDSLFISMFGGKEPPHTLSKKLAAIAKWDAMTKARVILIAPEGAGFTLPESLKKAGVRIIGAVSTVSDLFSAAGPVRVSPSVLSTVFGDQETYDKLCKMVGEVTGVNLSANYSRPVYWYDSFREGVA